MPSVTFTSSGSWDALASSVDLQAGGEGGNGGEAVKGPAGIPAPAAVGVPMRKSLASR
jgi:hypothetical protein